MTEALVVTAPQKRQVGFLLGLGILFFPLLFGWMLLRKGHSVLARIVVFIWMVLSLISLIGLVSISKSSYDGYKENAAKAAQSSTAAATPKESVQAEALKSYTSAKVAQDYEDNTIAADLQYKGNRVKVSGRITDINTDFLGKPYLVLTGTNQFMGPQFKFDKSALSSLASLKKGTQISVICTGKGDVVKTPMFEDCEVSK